MRNLEILKPLEVITNFLALASLSAGGLVLPSAVGVTPLVVEAAIPQELVVGQAPNDENQGKQKGPSSGGQPLEFQQYPKPRRQFPR